MTTPQAALETTQKLGAVFTANDKDEARRFWVLETVGTERPRRFGAVEDLAKKPQLRHPALAEHSLTAAGRRVLRLEETGFSSTLQVLLDNGDIQQPDAFIIFTAVLSAVRFLHSRHIVHCNINAAEIYVWQNPETGRVTQAKLGGIHSAHYEEDAMGFLVTMDEQRIVSLMGTRLQNASPSSIADFAEITSPHQRTAAGGGSAVTSSESNRMGFSTSAGLRNSSLASDGGADPLESTQSRLPPEVVEVVKRLQQEAPSLAATMNFGNNTTMFADTFRGTVVLGREDSLDAKSLSGPDPFGVDCWALGLLAFQLLHRGALPFPISDATGFMELPKNFPGFYFTKTHAAKAAARQQQQQQQQQHLTPTAPAPSPAPKRATVQLPPAPPPPPHSDYGGHPEPKVDAPLLRKMIPRLLCDAEKRLRAWQADSLLLHWTQLLQHGFPIHKNKASASRTLYAAISHSGGPRLDDIVALIQLGHDPLHDNKRPDRRTPLHAAVAIPDLNLARDICNILLSSATKPARLLEVQSRRGKTPLMCTIDEPATRRTELFEFLLSRCNELDVVVIPANVKVLRYCAEKDLVGQLNLMLDLWHDLAWPNAMLSRVIEEAAAKNAINTCKTIIHKVPPHLRGTEMTRAMRSAAENSQVDGCEELFKFVVSSGKGVKDVTEMATIALFAACSNDLADVVELALKHNADPLAFDADGNTPILIAATKGHRAALNCVFTHIPKAKSALAVAQCDVNGRTPLHHAARAGFDGCVSLLIDNGATPNCADPNRVTPLHLAAENGNTGACKVLINNGAWIDASLPDGTTPALLAGMNGQIETIRDALVPNGASLARYVDVGYRTVYDELVLHLSVITNQLNRLEVCRSPRVLVWGCVIWCVAVVAWLTIAAESDQLSWLHVGIALAFFFIHIGVMIVARYNVVDMLPNQELFNDLMPVRTILKSASAGVPLSLAEEAQFRVGAFRRELAPLRQATDIAAISPQKMSELRRRLQDWVRNFPRLGPADKDAAPPAAGAAPGAKGGMDATMALASSGRMGSTPIIGGGSPPGFLTGNASVNGGPRAVVNADAYSHAAVEVTDEIQFLDSKLSGTFNPSRQQTLRDAYLDVLSKAERLEGTSIMELPSPFANSTVTRLHARAFFKTFREHMALRLSSAFLMIVVFAGFGTAVFNADGAVSYHYANTHVARCTSVEDIRCSDWKTSVDWIDTEIIDCCYGDSVDDVRWCPGRVAAGLPIPGEEPAVAPSPSSGGGGASGSRTQTLIPPRPLPTGLNSTIGFDEDGVLTRFVYVRNADHPGTSMPVAQLRVQGCSLTVPRPRTQVRVIFAQADAFYRRLDAVAAFIFMGGIAVFLSQIALTIRFARRRSFAYLLYSTTRFETGLLKFYFLSTLHCGMALLACQMAIRLWRREPFVRVEKIGLSLAVVSVYPGLSIVTWFPLIGYVVAPTLLAVLLGLLFVLGLVLIFPLIPAMEAFSLPFFVTDPQRAIVSFAEKTSSRLFYVAIAVFWLLLLLRVFTAAAAALAPDSSGTYFNEVFRQYRVELAHLLPRREKRLAKLQVVATNGGDDDDDGERGSATGAARSDTSGDGVASAVSATGKGEKKSATGAAGGHGRANGRPGAAAAATNDPYLMNESIIGPLGKDVLGVTPNLATSMPTPPPPLGGAVATSATATTVAT